jgi:hypothetical protein
MLVCGFLEICAVDALSSTSCCKDLNGRDLFTGSFLLLLPGDMHDLLLNV